MGAFRKAIDATQRIGGGLYETGNRRTPLLEEFLLNSVVPERVAVIYGVYPIRMWDEEFYLQILLNGMGSLKDGQIPEIRRSVQGLHGGFEMFGCFEIALNPRLMKPLCDLDLDEDVAIHWGWTMIIATIG
jgi:hypothetical protein